MIAAAGVTAVADVVCNSGPLIALGKLNRLDLLSRLYDRIRIPNAVYHEVVVQGLARGHEDARVVQLFWQFRGWSVDRVAEQNLRAVQPAVTLGPGEHSALALALSLAEPLLLVDDAEARVEARRLGIRAKGTLGVLVEAVRRNVLRPDDFELLVRAIETRPDIWISAKLCQRVLESETAAGE